MLCDPLLELVSLSLYLTGRKGIELFLAGNPALLEIACEFKGVFLHLHDLFKTLLVLQYVIYLGSSEVLKRVAFKD